MLKTDMAIEIKALFKHFHHIYAHRKTYFISIEISIGTLIACFHGIVHQRFIITTNP